MNSLLWPCVVVLAFGLSYVTQLSGATLAMGRALSDVNSGRGFQDAITPPWQTNLSLAIYVGIVAVVGAMFWVGWASGVLAILAVIVISLVVRRLLPQPDSRYFQHLIIRSMANRYADYVKVGDVVRAEAMKGLLQKAGIDPDAAITSV